MRAEKGSVREEVIHYLTGYPAGACPSYYRASTVNLESTLNIRSMILDCERKPENPERTQTPHRKILDVSCVQTKDHFTKR